MKRTLFDAEAVRMVNPQEIDDETIQAEDRIQVLTPGPARARCWSPEWSSRASRCGELR